MSNTAATRKFLAKVGKPLEGGRVLWMDTAPSVEGEEYPMLAVEMPNGTLYRVCFLRDPEGNGPGWPEVTRIRKGGA